MAMTNAAGRVLRLTIDQLTSPTFGGEVFGAVGAYECLVGRAVCDLDPLHPRNAAITNLALAPRGADGRVVYSTDLCIMRPVERSRGNGWLFYELVNRGTKRALQRINGARANNAPATREDVGTGFLMREGFTLVWSGWQGDLVPGGGRMLAQLPPAIAGATPVTALCREEFILDVKGAVREDINEPIVEPEEGVFVAPLHYPAMAGRTAEATLTVRARERDARQSPPDLAWHFVDDRHIRVQVPRGFDRGAIYEFIYVARDPVVLGIGLAGIRDLVSWLRYDVADLDGTPNPLLDAAGVPPRRAMAFGQSQSGRVLRELVAAGLNADAQGRQVFDGIIPFVAGSRKAATLLPFTQTTRYSRQHEDHLYPGDQFPFGYAELDDPVSGGSGSVLTRARSDGVAPRVMHVDTESEIWSARASLCFTDCRGADITLPPDVRYYLLTGVPHGPFALNAEIATLPSNTLSYHFLARALIHALRAWIDDGMPPPASVHPSHGAGTLVTYEQAKRTFPAIPGVPFPPGQNELRVRDFTTQPPTEGAAYPAFVCAVDGDGNALGGIRHPLAAAPQGTFLGWNIRRDGYAQSSLLSVFGGHVPFARTRRERLAVGDPRPSIEERYGGHAAWVARVEQVTADLVARRLLLERDAAALMVAARQSTDVFTAI